MSEATRVVWSSGSKSVQSSAISASVRCPAVRHPERQHLPQRGAHVEQQPVYLLHPVIASGAARQRDGLANGVHRETGRVDDAQRGQGQRQHSLGVHVLLEQALGEVMNLLLVDGR